jgi:D-alanyl-D-alanine-carboxypeptidase/D-alanyl-D-alanine-endopeptidase
LGSTKLPGKRTIERIIAPYMKAGNIGFAIGAAILQAKRKSAHYLLGKIRNYRCDELQVDEHTNFQIASITKIFTAALLTRHAVRDKSLWSKKVGAYHPPGMAPLPAPFKRITLLNLANYTSGLPQDNEYPAALPQYVPEPYTSLSMYSFLNEGNVSPSGVGTTFSYSNLAFALLSHALPEAVGRRGYPFARLLKDDITDPLGLHDTKLFSEVPMTRLPLGVSGCQFVSSGWPEFFAYLGAGGLVSTPVDMMRWLLFNMGMMPEAGLNDLLKPMQTPSTSVIDPYNQMNNQLGVGWFIYMLPAMSQGQAISLPVVWKDGMFDGSSSIVAFVQSRDPGREPSRAGLFVMTNSTCKEVMQIAFDILLSMNGCTRHPRHVLGVARRSARRLVTR